jgi:hypothetical protein
MKSNEINELISELSLQFKRTVPIPEFFYKDGRYCHINHKTITVIKNENEMLTEPHHKESLLLAVYNNDSNKNQCWLFTDAMRDAAIHYSNENSTIIDNGKIIDIRRTMGAAITAETTGLWEEEAYHRIETICKLQLTIYKSIHLIFGEWISDFYSENNSDLIDLIVCQITESVVEKDEKLKECFAWLRLNTTVISEKIENILPFTIQLPMTKESDWKTFREMNFNGFIKLLNCFNIELKKYEEDWDTFLSSSKAKDSAQNALINILKNDQQYCSLTIKYLTEENKQIHRGSITACKFGV